MKSLIIAKRSYYVENYKNRKIKNPALKKTYFKL